MRYLQVEAVPFRAPDGRVVAVKIGRVVTPNTGAAARAPVLPGGTLDEVASRPEVYGAGAEGQAYRLFDENAIEIMQSRYTLEGVRELRVP